ncbi:hypothetical protein RIF29_22488 [Crotalaria pallida]|uniref:Uncharacterized protein n=1 Tax=Crotalaria pallida TaxID=3830 RepID=A0AAN9I6X1_CROPI
MEGGRACKKPRIDLSEDPECDMEVELSSMTKLTPGKHVLKGDRKKSYYTQSSVVKCDSGKNSKRGLVIASVSHDFDLNSNPVDYSSNDGNFDAGFHFEICEMDDANVQITFEVGSSSRCQTQREACEGDDGFVMDDFEEVEEEILHDNHFCEDDDYFLGGKVDNRIKMANHGDINSLPVLYHHPVVNRAAKVLTGSVIGQMVTSCIFIISVVEKDLLPFMAGQG